MIHLFKVQLQHSDMFIKRLSFTTKMIVYSIRDKVTGNLLEPVKVSKFEEASDGTIKFDERFIATPFAKYIQETLES